MSKGIFVTGTDTGVGKTLIASALTAALARRGLRVAVMKPVETGCPLRESDAPQAVDGFPGELDREAQQALRRLTQIAGPPPITVSTRTDPSALDPLDALSLTKVANCDAPIDRVNPYRYAPAVAPALAAELAQRPIDLGHILDCLRQLAAESDIVVVEGAGGLLVPLTERELIVDLAVRLGFPALVVGRSALGTINHSLLTLAQLEQHRVPLAGLVLNRLTKRPSPEEAANPHQIERFAGDVVRGVMPHIPQDKRTDADYLAERFAVHVDLDAILDAVEAAPGRPQ